jgi:phosphoribosylformimino-5-aminoimidazole carboxamide ribonucleotide (ProFAR) isomerase
MTLLYSKIGKTINSAVLKNVRVAYSKQIIVSLAQHLTEKYGRGWSEKHLRHCLRIAETFPDKEIVSTLSRQLS